MSSISDLLDFESLLPVAVQSVLNAQGFAAFTALDAPVNQRPRPRVDLFFKTGSAATSGGQASTHLLTYNGISQKVPQAWNGTLILHCVTACDEPGKLVHAAYRSNIRALMMILPALINGPSDGSGLQNHKLQLLVESGTSHGIRSSDGYEQSTISYDCFVSIQQNAWALFTFSGSN